MTVAEVDALIEAYGRSSGIVRKKVLDVIRGSWGALDSYRDADIERWIRQVVPIVEGGSRRTAVLADAYLARLERLTLGNDATALGVNADDVTTEALRGVEAAEVYRRPAVELYTALSNGTRYDQAVKMGLDRAIDIASMDLQLAKTHTSQRVLASKDGVAGYRRTLTGSKSCGLCVVASTQRYHKKDLLPCHPGCDCGVKTIYGDDDPGHVVDEQTLAQAHASIDERFGAFNSGAREIPGVSNPDGTPTQYRDVLVVHEHGEIGPILGVRGQHFDGPSVVN